MEHLVFDTSSKGTQTFVPQNIHNYSLCISDPLLKRRGQFFNVPKINAIETCIKGTCNYMYT